MEAMRYPEHGTGRLLPTGVMQEINPNRQIHAKSRGDEALEYAKKAETHLWLVFVQHFATNGVLDAHDGIKTAAPILDADTMADLPRVFCLVCEEPYEPRLRHRKCPGEPR